VRHTAWILAVLVAAPAAAQESQFGADVRREKEHVATSCGDFNPKGIATCGYALVTENPFHVALGNLAPMNGFAGGLAFAEHYTPSEAWRISWNADGVASGSGSWRAGAYVKLIHTPATSGVVVREPGARPAAPDAIAPREFTVIDLFAQATSLETINYFGLGQQSLEAGRSVFGEHQTVAGASVTVPLGGIRAIDWLRMSVTGGVAGRFIDVRSATLDQVPSIDQVYDESTAPGLSDQPAFVQFREAVRFRPSFAGGWLRLDYLAAAEQFRASQESASSFNRWTVDLRHEIPLYRNVASTGPRSHNGPNECTQSLSAPGCPPVQWSRNRQGSITLRLLVSAATASAGGSVPFYLQPTLGGSNINGEPLLASHQDYRFRGPYMLALQERLEHSIWGPFGILVMAEQGKVAVDRADLDFTGLASSATVGLTLRAGGFPMVTLSFSWGSEGHHVTGTMGSTLLGGSLRPSLY
jgi:hypothetical protein